VPERDPSSEDEALRARLAKLSSQLGDQKANEARTTASEASSVAGSGETARAMSLGFRVLAEFVAGVSVGGLIGWFVDGWLRTSPLLLIVFLALGTAAGFWNVYKIAAASTRPGRG